MKKSLCFMLICSAAWLNSCKKDVNDPYPTFSGTEKQKEIFEGVVIDNSPSYQPSLYNVYLKGRSATESGFAVADGTKTVLPNDDGSRGYDYRFKLVGEYATLKVTNSKGKVVETQATHIKITDDAKYAFVSYNTRNEDYIGGIVVFNVSNIANPTVVATLSMNNGELSAIDYDPVKSVLYATGATNSRSYGYQGDANPAFVISVALDGSMKFKDETPSFKMLTSYQGTSIKVANGYVYATTGDGTQGTKGGLYVLNKELTKVVNFTEAVNARSIDTDENGNLYLMQAEYAKITKFDCLGNNPQLIYSAEGEAKQRYAKSEIAVWNGYVFAAENESGVRMININDQSLTSKLVWPAGSDPDDHVTNSVAINVDKKSYSTGGSFNSNLLLLANGGKGLYWYDIIDGKITLCNNNSINFGYGNSANYVASKGNVAFVADGLGGLKILSIDVDLSWDCSNSFSYYTFLKDNGNDKGNPLSRKVGDVIFVAEGNNLAVYIFSDIIPADFEYDISELFNPNVKTLDLKNAGIIFGSSLEYFDNYPGLFTGNGSPKDKNINNGTMRDMNKEYRTIIPGGVKFTFPKGSAPLANGTGLCIIYSGNGAWGYGDPNGPSGATGTGANNNGQIITLGEVNYCEPK